MLTKNDIFWLTTMLINAFFHKKWSMEVCYTYMSFPKKKGSLKISYVLEHRLAKS